MGAPSEAYRTRFPVSLLVATAFVTIPFVLSTLVPDIKSYPPPLNPAGSDARQFPLEISPNPVSLGVLTAGRSVRSTVTLRNRGRQPVTVNRIEASCPCLRIHPNAFEIGAGEADALTFEFDHSAERDFQGDLAINVVGYDGVGNAAFRTRVDLHIQAETRKEEGARRPPA
ncbi:MAG: DUF1573 domain-containing protein [Isosphaerales bacterium]